PLPSLTKVSQKNALSVLISPLITYLQNLEFLLSTPHNGTITIIFTNPFFFLTPALCVSKAKLEANYLTPS
ncbi:MAG: hypothetical protein ACYSU4_02120, partial [Planctomycetota bacterium]